MSIRYADADSWVALLRRFAEQTAKPYEFYSSSADGDLPRVASLLADEFHTLWWEDPRYAEQREQDARLITQHDSALKLEISRYVAGFVSELPTTGPLAGELALLKAAVIDGIITTNYDPILEVVRDDLHPFVGQDELLFADPQGVGEIYKIHGSCSQPDSLVLTAEDYERFDERNAYLVAKLLTIFVEHPVIFLGYSLSDRNIQQILVGIARCLVTDERIQQLADRLLFVEYQEGATPQMGPTVIAAEGFTIPIQRIVVPDFTQVFSVLGTTRRRFSARLLRHLRQEVYDLVKTSRPSERLYVEDLDDDTNLADVEVYAGIGAISRLTTSYVGLSRDDLLHDVLLDAGYDASRVVTDVLPHVGSNVHVPVYKYLRGADLLDSAGQITGGSVPERVVERVASRESRLAGHAAYAKRAERIMPAIGSLAELVPGREPTEVLYLLPYMPRDRLAPQDLRGFLIANQVIFDARAPAASQWARIACLYDWIQYGPELPADR
jgi:hypothetical protein